MNPFILPKTKDPIEAKSLLTYTDVDLFLHTGNILSSLQQFERAINDFRKVTKESKNKSVLASAWNGMGLCYRALKGKKTKERR